MDVEQGEVHLDTDAGAEGGAEGLQGVLGNVAVLEQRGDQLAGKAVGVAKAEKSRDVHPQANGGENLDGEAM